MRENCTYGLTRGRAYPTRGAPLYSTCIDTAAALVPGPRGCAYSFYTIYTANNRID